MKKFVLAIIGMIWFAPYAWSQKDATIKEFSKAFPTYPFSDPNPIPLVEKIYPYFRYDGLRIDPFRKNGKWWNLKTIISG